MKKRTLAAWAVMVLGMGAMAQQVADPVVMKINGKEVIRSEFEYSYNKNNSEQTLDKKTLDEYVQLFVDFKLKVAEAEAQQLDTLASFKNELKGYRAQQAQEYLVDTAWIEDQARQVYDNTVANIGPAGLVLTSHILLMIPQDASEAVQKTTMMRMDSIYNALVGGADFAELATKYSQDPGSARQGGQLPWLFAKQVYAEYADVAYSLQVGELSKPFLSPAGVHVVKLLEKKQFEPYSFHRADIHRFLEQRGVRQKAIEVKLDALYKQYGGKVKREDVLAYEEKELEKKYPEFRHLMQEYYDGLLLFEVSNREVWEKASRDEKGLEKFFKKNKKKYAWDAPRFKGAVVHCATPELATSVGKALKKMPEEEWRNYLQKEVNRDSLQLVHMVRGLFKIGSDANVDSLVFKQGAGKPMEKYPHAVVVGKVQKKYPGSYRDVRGPVTADYQTTLEKQWIESLRKKYKVEIYSEVLETVNKH